MKKAKNGFFTARNVAVLGVLTALVIILQAFGLVIAMPGGTSMSFVLVPILVGGMILGPVAGLFLGLVFGVVTLFDPLALALMNYTPAVAVVTVVLKGVLAGVVPALIFKAFENKNRYAAAFAAAVSAPITNTGIFILGCLCMQDAITACVGSAFWAFIGLIMINFAIELAVNVVLAPAVYSVDRAVEKRFAARASRG